MKGNCFKAKRVSLSRKLRRKIQGLKIVTQLCKILVLANMSCVFLRITVRLSDIPTTSRFGKHGKIKRKYIFFLHHLAFISWAERQESTDWNYDLGNSGKCGSLRRTILLANAGVVCQLNYIPHKSCRLSRYFVKSLQVVCVYSYVLSMWQIRSENLYSERLQHKAANVWNV